MTLHVHHGPRLDLLADRLAAVLATPLDDPFAAEVVAVPTAGVRDLVIRHAAATLGVSANIDFPFPERFVATALGHDPGTDDPWAPERLVWAVLDVLESGVVDVPGWRAACQAGRSRRFAVARRIADLFDRYAVNRPEMLQQWAAGAPGDGTVRERSAGGADTVGALDESFHWQFQLWRAVRAAIGQPAIAEQLPGLLAALRGGEAAVALPSRVSWFGVNAVPASRLAVLETLAVVREVHLWVAHPSAAAWATTPPQPSGWLLHRRRFAELSAAAAPVGHPLVRSWGHAAAEVAALVNGAVASDRSVVLDPVLDADLGPPPARPTLLRHLQADIAADRPPTPFDGDPRDGSLQVHACHGPTRQLEVLRDVLGHLFVADPTLEPRDVVVLCPDLARFEPFAEAVLGRGSLPVPATVTDLSLGSENPVARALLTILGVLAGRGTALDVLTVATLDPVRSRLGLTVDDLDRITGWVGQLGTSWGYDGHHRADVLGIDPDPDLAGGTWEATLRSLLVGAAMPSPSPRAVAAAAAAGATAVAVVPHDDMTAEAFTTAGRLAELVARLSALRAIFAAERTVEEWCAVLHDTVDALCATAPGDAWQLTAVHDAIDEVRVAAAGRVTRLPAHDVRAVVEHVVTEYRGRLRMRTGAVTITGLAPLRNVPARVVCLLGFDEVSLRAAGVDGDDVLSTRPCVGEPDRRTDRRQVVLDALLAARDHFVIVCDGNDITTNRRVRFAVALTELLDAVDASLSPTGAADGGHGLDESPVVQRHHLRSYDERAFDAAAPFGFDDAMVAAATVRRGAESVASAPFRRWSIGAPAEARGDAVVTIAELLEACTRPARTLLRSRLDVRLPGEVVDIDTSIPLAVSPLDSAALGRRLLDRYRAAASAEPGDAPFDRQALEARVLDEWLRAESLAGRLPPGQLVRQSLDDVSRELIDLVDAAVKAVGGPLDHRAVLGASRTLDIDIAVIGDGDGGAVRVVDRLDAIADAGRAGSALCRLSYTRPKARTYVEAALQLAAAVVATGRTDWVAVTATRGVNRSSRPEATVLGVQGAMAGAQQLLDVAASIHAHALSGPVPLFEETSRVLHATGVFDEELLLGNDFKRGDLGDLETGFVWNGTTTADILRLGPKPWADRLWGAIGAFVFDWSEAS